MPERSPNHRVLVIDDDPDIRDVLCLLLADQGYDVCDAPDGQAALEQLTTWKPDLILLDLMMPVMDGWSFRQHQLGCRDGLAEIPTVILSASHCLSDGLVQLQPTAILPKPFDVDLLLSTVGSLVSQS